MIDGNNFFDVPIKNKKETSKKILKWVRIMTIQQAIHKIINIFQVTTN